MAGDIAMVSRIYELAGQPMTAEAVAAMEEFMTTHPRGRFGTVNYDLGQLGLGREERRGALRFYVDRFGTQCEDTT
jgi:hypothetical protein